jgi:hypothetical protein
MAKHTYGKADSSSAASRLVDKIREGATTIASEVLRRTNGDRAAAQDAVAQYVRQTQGIAEGVAAGREMDRLAAVTVAHVDTGAPGVVPVPFSGLDLYREVSGRIHEAMRDAREIREGRGPMGDGNTHRFGEAANLDDVRGA